jgi:hypothetical protein
MGDMGGTVSWNSENSDFDLTPEPIAEIERCMSDDEPFASEEEVREVFERLTK